MKLVTQLNSYLSQHEQKIVMGRYLIDMCKQKEKIECMRVLTIYKNSCALDQVDQYNYSALMYACRNSMDDVCMKILENSQETYNNCALSKRNNMGATCLILACENNMEQVCMKILETPYDCAMEQITKYGTTALIAACNSYKVDGKQDNFKNIIMENVCMKILSYPNVCSINYLYYGNSFSRKIFVHDASIIACESKFENVCMKILKYYSKDELYTVAKDLLISAIRNDMKLVGDFIFDYVTNDELYDILYNAPKVYEWLRILSDVSDNLLNDLKKNYTVVIKKITMIQLRLISNYFLSFLMLPTYH